MLGKCFGKSAATKRERYSFDDSIQDQFARGSMRSLFIDETIRGSSMFGAQSSVASLFEFSCRGQSSSTKPPPPPPLCCFPG
jgi:ABC-type enterochelin transport system substrate-binding protein